MKKLVIFDLDGTLVNSLSSISYCGNYALQKLGLPTIKEDLYKTLLGDGLDELIKRMLQTSGDKDFTNFDDAKSFYKEIFETGCLYQVKAYDNIIETISKIKSENIKVAVFSNKDHYYTCKVVESIFGSETFDFVLGKKDQNPPKPDPMGALLIANHFNIQPNDCVYVGDTNTDMKTGTSAGMFTVGVSWGFRPVSELEEFGAMKIISNPLELLNIVL